MQRMIHQGNLPIIIIIILNAVDSDFIVFVYTIFKRFLWAGCFPETFDLVDGKSSKNCRRGNTIHFNWLILSTSEVNP